MSRQRHTLGLRDEVEQRSTIVSGYLFETSWENEALGLRFQTDVHGGISKFVSYSELTRLLSREDINRLDVEMRRQQRHSGVESLSDINERYDIDDYVALD